METGETEGMGWKEEEKRGRIKGGEEGKEKGEARTSVAHVTSLVFLRHRHLSVLRHLHRINSHHLP